MPFISNIRTIQSWMLFSCTLLNANSALLPLLNRYFDFFLAKLTKSTLSKMFVVYTCCMFPVVFEIVAKLQTLL